MGAPNSIAANVGLAGGAPTDPETTAAYLTQLQQSLNGFTGSTAAALNYLLGIAAGLPVQKTLHVTFFNSQVAGGGGFDIPAGVSSSALTGYVYAGMASSQPTLGAPGNPMLITPAATGRIALIGYWIWQDSFFTAPEGGNVNSILQMGTGTPPIQGATATGSTQIGFGSVAQKVTASTNFITQQFMVPMALMSGLSTTTQYWFDTAFSSSINTSGTGGTIQDGSFMIAIEC
jgi:hypothetical protein